MQQPHLQAGRLTCRSGGSGSRGYTCSFAYGIQQGFESVGKQLDAVDRQFVRHFFHEIPALARSAMVLAARSAFFRQAGTQPAVIAERINRRRRNRVHRVRADQLFDIHDVPIFWILGAGAGPKQPLRLSALGRQGFPARAAEQLLILLVGELGVGDSHLAAEAFEQLLLTGVRRGLEFFVDLAINKSVYAADKKSSPRWQMWLMSGPSQRELRERKGMLRRLARKRTAQRAA